MVDRRADRRRAPLTRPGARGFSLLEALVALVLLAAAAAACLQIRTDALRARRAVDESLRADRDAEALLDMLFTGTIDKPYFDDQEQRYVWEGELNGEPYRITRTPEDIDNPMHGRVSHDVAKSVRVLRYRVERFGQVSEFVSRQ